MDFIAKHFSNSKISYIRNSYIIAEQQRISQQK